jgi:hypothetical protein
LPLLYALTVIYVGHKLPALTRKKVRARIKTGYFSTLRNTGIVPGYAITRIKAGAFIIMTIQSATMATD